MKKKETKKSSVGKKTRILLIEGNDDFGALEIENSIGIKKAAEMVERGESLCTDEIDAEGTILEFDAIDPEFIQFVFDEMCDYDSLKNKCFYVID